ncbi:MAG: HAMP domain-containing histidine kinase [Halomonas sp.]|uniref:sensor histidine kinase n=1 Tax=Halomonas sp. TaxID=1486246 RepID=UPI001A05D5A2|nr:HAMP domain-containing sensor histidine kinase [Halomonas sp.]MBE0487530.1 HAMP domain-containing histidine kinase [Halomonas sp.]
MSRPSASLHDLAHLDACRRRLAWRYALGMALGLCAVLLVGYLMHSALVKQSLKSELVQLAQREAEVHQPDLEAWVAGRRGPEDVTIGFRPHRTAFYYVLGPDSRLVHGNETRPSLRDEVLALLKSNALPRDQVVFEEILADEEGVLQLALLRHPVKDAEGRYLGSVYAATDVGGSLAHLEQLLVLLLLLALGFVVLAGLGGWWMADRSLQPLQQALRQQREFIASASHELRAPLTVMNTALALVEREGRERLDDFHHQTLVDARDEVRRLGRLAEALLLLARMDAGGLSLRRERLALGEVVDRQLRLRRPRIEAHRQSLTSHLAEGLRVVGDADLLARLVGAGLDNAADYTPSGGAISVSLLAEAGRARLEIADSGPGMSEQQCRRAFERFYRGDPSRQRHQGGAGLGLAIIDEVARQHGGEARLFSAPGEGTRLVVTLPLAP